MGVDAMRDMRVLCDSPETPTILDVGANVGQTITRFRQQFAAPVIHSFEPGPDTFRELQRRCAHLPDVHLNHLALGAESGKAELLENDQSDMSSLLEPAPDSWGQVEKRTEVPVSTVDDYCERAGIEAVHILKSDTQGFDLEVMRGAESMMARGAIQMIYTEIILSDMYRECPRLDEIFAHVADRGFSLVAFYQFHFQHQRASWTDALFVNPDFPVSRRAG